MRNTHPQSNQVFLFFRPAYSVERWVRSDFVVRVKQFYGTRDVAYLLDRVMPFIGQRIDGLIAETAEGSCLVKPKKYKNHHPIDLQARFQTIDQLTNEGIYSVWSFNGRTKKYIEWKEHGFLAIPASKLPEVVSYQKVNGKSLPVPIVTKTSFHDINNKIVEVEIREQDEEKSLIFKTLRDSEKLFPNEIKTVHATVANYRQNIKLDELFPKELFEKGYLQPASWKVIHMRTEQGLDWSDFRPDIASVVLADPVIVVPVSRFNLMKLWKTKCSAYSLEGTIYLQSRVS